jgi:transcriptional regulator with XRE-family HTH domain
MAEFKDRLKELRKERGLSQQGLADALSKTKTTIYMYENGSMFPKTAVAYFKYEKGQREPNIDTLIGIAQFFDVTTDYLLGLSDERKPKIIEKQLDLSTVSTEELLKEIHKRII